MIAKLNARLDAYFESHFIPYVIKEVIVGVSQIVWAALDSLFWMLLAGPIINGLISFFRLIGLEEWFRDFGHRHFYKGSYPTQRQIENGSIICPVCEKIIKRKLTVCPHCHAKIWRHEADSDLWWWNAKKVNWL